MVAHAKFLTFRRWRQKGQNFKDILGYMVFRSQFGLHDTLSKREEKQLSSLGIACFLTCDFDLH